MGRRRVSEDTETSAPQQTTQTTLHSRSEEGTNPPDHFKCPWERCGKTSIGSECERIDRVSWKCPSCGNALSHVNAFDVKGVSKMLNSIRNGSPNAADVGEVVSGGLGEEVYTPRQYCTFKIAATMSQTTIRPGETRADAFRRLVSELEEVREEERSRRMKSFMAALKRMDAIVKGGE